MVFKFLGKVFLVEAVLLILPLIISFIYRETDSWYAYVIPICGLTAIGFPLSLIKSSKQSFYAKEGLVTVAFSWIFLSLAGAVPFLFYGINYVDAVFETVSGFTTTGASVIPDVEVLPHSIMFWRIFTHFLGGMGILVFVLAIMPKFSSGVMHVFRAESPGPTVGKLVSKVKFTARILYGIYCGLTLIEFIMLVLGGMPVFDSILMSFSTAGTGGFGTNNNSAAGYSTYCQIVMAVFMFIFSINFNAHYFIIIGSFKKALKSEEVRVYTIITVIATILIALNVFYTVGSIYTDFGTALKDAFFQVTSISSSTGLTSIDYDKYFPTFSKTVLLFLMIFGACAGSTGGGIKTSRLVIFVKSVIADIKNMISPRSVYPVKFEGEAVDEKTVKSVKTYFGIWLLIVIISTLLLSIDAFGDVLTDLTATLACFGNTGPGLNMVGPAMNYGGYSVFSKIWLSIVMIAGRLEIFPVLILLFPSTWIKK